MVAHAVHDTTHHLKDIGRGLHSLGAGAVERGTVEQVQRVRRRRAEEPAALGRHRPARGHRRPPGGAPAPRQADAGPQPLVAGGDRRAAGRGAPPIRAGAAGENVTVAGIDWATLRPGARILLGDVLIEISAYATPCKKNAQWFADRDFTRIDHGRHPGLEPRLRLGPRGWHGPPRRPRHCRTLSRAQP